MAILLADDDKVMQTLTATFLKRHGLNLIYAQNSAQVLQMVASTIPEMFILDIMMPGITGIELCRMLRNREDTKSKPIIMLSALNDTQTRYNCLDAGASAFLCKSELQRLPAVVNTLLQGNDVNSGLREERR